MYKIYINDQYKHYDFPLITFDQSDLSYGGWNYKLPKKPRSRWKTDHRKKRR